REREQRVTDILAEQRDEIGRHMDGRTRRREQVQHRNGDRKGAEQHEENHRAAVEDADEAERHHASIALPCSANMPRGRFWMNRMISTRIAILPSTAPANGSRNLLAMPSVSAPTSVTQRLPT